MEVKLQLVLDLGVSHHITSNLQNIPIQSEDGSGDDTIIDDGTGGPIIQTRFTKLVTPSSILCAPSLKKNKNKNNFNFPILQIK